MSRRMLSGWRANCAMAVGVSWLALILAGFTSPSGEMVRPRPALAQQQETTSDPADELPGTWLREYSEDGVRSRRLLHLDQGGSFREEVRIVSANGEVTRQEHAGHWFFDGTNLKRKYTLMNGEPPSRLNLPFATFAIQFQSRDNFVGTDHIRQRTVRYERVSPQTQL